MWIPTQNISEIFLVLLLSLFSLFLFLLPFVAFFFSFHCSLLSHPLPSAYCQNKLGLLFLTGRCQRGWGPIQSFDSVLPHPNCGPVQCSAFNGEDQWNLWLVENSSRRNWRKHRRRKGYKVPGNSKEGKSNPIFLVVWVVLCIFQ